MLEGNRMEGAGLQRERMERNRIIKDKVKGLTG